MGSDNFGNFSVNLVVFSSLTLSVLYKSLLHTLLLFRYALSLYPSSFGPGGPPRFSRVWIQSLPASWLWQGQLLCPWTDGLSSITSTAPVHWG